MQRSGFDGIKEGIKSWKIILTVFIYHILAIFVSKLNVEFLNINYIKLDMVLALVFGILLLLSKIELKETSKKIIKKYYGKVIALLLLLISTGNLIYNATYSMRIIRTESSMVDQNTYSLVVNLYEEAIVELESFDNELYRTEKKMSLTINDSLTFGYNGIGYSASTYSKKLHQFLRNMGIQQDHVYVKYNINGTKVTDMLLGIKYLMVNKSDEFLKKYELYENQPSDEIAEKVIKIYKNPYNLALGYAVSNDIFGAKLVTQDTFEFQNNILKSMTNIEKNVYKEHEGIISEFSDGIKKEGLTYKKEREDARFGYEIEVESTDNLYVYIIAKDIGNSTLYINGEEFSGIFTSGSNEMINLGKRNIGEKVKLEIEPKNEEFSVSNIYGYYENEEIIKEHYEKLKDEQLDLKQINNTKYEGKINVKNNNQSILITFPYEEGWKIILDGEEVEYKEALNGLMAIETGVGEHEIILEYRPIGLDIGLLLSVVGIGLFIVSVVISKKKE